VNLLVIQDQPTIALLRRSLKEHGYVVEACHSARAGLEHALSQAYGAIILDVVFPGGNGLRLLRALRESDKTTPVIILSGRMEVAERVEGFNAGADCYLGKPVVIEELVARLRALLRRSRGEDLTVHRVGKLSLNVMTHEVRYGARRIELSAYEFRLLECLMRGSPNVLRHVEILERVWGSALALSSDPIGVYISRLRKKLGVRAASGIIQAVRGTGYRLVAS